MNANDNPDRPDENTATDGRGPAVVVVTDSSCDLPAAVADELGIVIVPLTIRFGEEEFVDRAELHVVPSLGEHLTDRILVEGPRVGEAGPTLADDPDPDALTLRRDEVLDVAVVDTHLGLAAAGDERLDLLAWPRLLDHSIGNRLQLTLEPAHRAPPSVTPGV